MDEWTVQIASAGFQDRIRKARTYSSRATKRFLARHKSDFAERPDEVVRGNLSVASYRPHSFVKYFPGVEVTNGSKLASYQYLDGFGGSGFEDMTDWPQEIAAEARKYHERSLLQQGTSSLCLPTPR